MNSIGGQERSAIAAAIEAAVSTAQVDAELRYDIRTLILPAPKGAFRDAGLALMHQGKNLYNTGLFLVRQVFSAYTYDSDAKVCQLRPDSELHPIQIDAIAHFNEQIARINAAREVKFPAKQAKDPEAKLKLVESLTPMIANMAAILLDATVLDNVMRNWPNKAGISVYARIPGAMAQQVRATLTDNFKSFYAALAKFHAGKASGSDTGMTGRPRMPGYLGKHDRFVLEIPLAQVHGGLPALKGKIVPVDYAETAVLTEDQLQAFSTFDIHGAIHRAVERRGWNPLEVNPHHIRLVPKGSGKNARINLEVVVRVANPYPAHSFLGRMLAAHGAVWSAFTKTSQRDAWLLAYLADQPFGTAADVRIAAIDLGVNNLAATAFSTGHKATVLTHGRFESVVGRMAAELDAFVSAHTPERAKELQRKKAALQDAGKGSETKDTKDAKAQLPKAEHIELNQLLREVYALPEYRALLGKKERWIADFLHKASRGLVRDCKAKCIDVIVIGRNKGWKQEVDMGKTQNRRFCQTAHATLISYIKYKAEAYGIAVVTTEESYTSKTSFVENESLPMHRKQTKQEKENTNINAVPSAGRSADPVTKVKTQPLRSGKRSSGDRNRFAHKNRNDRWKVVHADVNGAFNIIRKIFRHFAYSARLTLKYTITRLSPRLGLVAVLL